MMPPTDYSQDLADAHLFQDVMSFLRYLEKQPITKTATGNISRKDIHALGETMHCIKYVSEVFADMGWKIQSQWQVRDLDLVRFICQVMYTIYHTKTEIRISKNGLGFLQLDDIYDQASQVAMHYFERVSWSSGHPGFEISGGATLLDIIQNGQDTLWHELVLNHTAWIDFTKFTQTIHGQVVLMGYRHGKLELSMDLEYGLLRPLHGLGCLELSEKVVNKKFDRKKIVRFRPTKFGIRVFCQELEDPLYHGNRPVTNIWKN
jgi:hypothetical protein